MKNKLDEIEEKFKETGEIDEKLVINLNESSIWAKSAAIYLIYKINQDLTKWEAFKLGLIDNKGNIIKAPSTPQERRSLDSFDRLILFIRRHLPLFALRVLSAYSVFKLVTENTEDDVMPSEKTAEDTMAYLYTKMLTEAYERGITHEQIHTFIHNNKE